MRRRHIVILQTLPSIVTFLFGKTGRPGESRGSGYEQHKAGAASLPYDTIFAVGDNSGLRLRTAFSTIGCNPSPPAST